ncbi:MAG: septation protein IspZ [Buchnera aphidicola (Schlechtendalia peitan)]
MKHFLNFFPILIFFIIYKFYDIFIASAVLIISTIVTCILIKFLLNEMDKTDYINCISSFLFGSLTLLFHNSNYIKWKATIIYLILALILLMNYLLNKKSLIQHLLEKKITLNNSIWRKLTIIWSFFFLVCASINSYAVLYLSENTWITLKVFGLTFLTLLFMLFNGIYINHLISKHK